MIQRVARDFAGGIVKSSHAGRGRPPEMPTSSVSTEAIAASISLLVSGATGRRDRSGWARRRRPRERSLGGLKKDQVLGASGPPAPTATRVLSSSMSPTVSSGATRRRSVAAVRRRVDRDRGDGDHEDRGERGGDGARDAGQERDDDHRDGDEPSMSHRRVPVRNSIAPSVLSVLKLPNCASRMTIASPLTNPSMTGWGTMRMSFPRLQRPTTIWISPQSTTAGRGSRCRGRRRARRRRRPSRRWRRRSCRGARPGWR
jgi:hypothetical protein